MASQEIGAYILRITFIMNRITSMSREASLINYWISKSHSPTLFIYKLGESLFFISSGASRDIDSECLCPVNLVHPTLIH